MASFTTLAAWLGLREKTPETNWLAHEDIGNLLTLSSFERVRWDSKILLPIYIPLLSNFVNRYVALLPFFRMFSLVNIVVARPLLPAGERPSVSIVVPARNEAGNIQAIVERVPSMGPDDELIFVEGNSTDDTWEVWRVHRKMQARAHRHLPAGWQRRRRRRAQGFASRATRCS